jgi:hypothetical protein
MNPRIFCGNTDGLHPEAINGMMGMDPLLAGIFAQKGQLFLLKWVKLNEVIIKSMKDCVLK